MHLIGSILKLCRCLQSDLLVVFVSQDRVWNNSADDNTPKEQRNEDQRDCRSRWQVINTGEDDSSNRTAYGKAFGHDERASQWAGRLISSSEGDDEQGRDEYDTEKLYAGDESNWSPDE